MNAISARTIFLLYLTFLLMSPSSMVAFIQLTKERHSWPIDKGLSTLSSSSVSTLFVSASMQIPIGTDDSSSSNSDGRDLTNAKQRVKRKYKRKRAIPETEKLLSELKQQWKNDYEKIVNNATVQGERCPSIWSFESLFPPPVLDEASITSDLYGTREQDAKTMSKRKTNVNAATDQKQQQQLQQQTSGGPINAKMKSPFYGGPSIMSLWRERRLSSADLPGALDEDLPSAVSAASQKQKQKQGIVNGTAALSSMLAAAAAALEVPPVSTSTSYPQTHNNKNAVVADSSKKVDRDLTRMVEDRIYGYRRTRDGSFQYETSLMGDGAVQFRDGVRLGKPLSVNADRLTYFAKKELLHGRVEEAQELYEQAILIDPQDGRAYLGLSRCAERRRDFALARECLRAGIAQSTTWDDNKDGYLEDRGANPFLLQALGCLEEKMGHLSQAEALYISAVKSRPWHAAAWVALAQLRTRKLGKSAEAGRALFQTAERELHQAGKPQSSHVYTAWASLEYHDVRDVRRARELYKAALKLDPKCSAAHLQLGLMEADCGNWDEAQRCFDAVLKFDQRNSRVLQAYAIMETKRPGGDSQKAIDMFERALKVNPRDAGAFQAYGLYVAKLGDVESARDLLKRATEANKRHAAAWQSWGLLEMKEGDAEQARSIFQQGIWACAQLAGVQSGGYDCARLWQAWGLLEAHQGDHAAARRCFSRALDADSRNVAAVTAWMLMEEGLGNVGDARVVVERALKQFAPGSEAKRDLWSAYEAMEVRLGNTKEAQRVYQRSIREALAKENIAAAAPGSPPVTTEQAPSPDTNNLTVSSEFEVVRWDGGSSSLRGEVWMNDRVFESKILSKQAPQISKKKTTLPNSGQ